MKRITTLFLLLTAMLGVAEANDGVFFTTGNFLVPTKETDISVKKEILTITIGSGEMATVDVYYEFMNSGNTKTVTMAFEAEPPYNANAKFEPSGVHPYIKNFTVNMNGRPLTYDNKVIATRIADGKHQVDFTPLDLTKWKGNGDIPDSLDAMDDALYNAELDSLISFAYGYFFTATFQPGLNKVHHTYSFQMSYRVGEKFVIPYWLTPATRWANNQIDDFTLRIKNEREAQDFCMGDSLFAGADFKVVEGMGELYQLKVTSGEPYLLASVNGGGVVEWHAKNFRPTAEMEISDAARILTPFGFSQMVVIDADGMEYLYIGDCGDSYMVMAQDYNVLPKKGCHVAEYSVDNGRGWVYPKDYGTYNVRQSPSTKSPVIGKMKYVEGEMPEPCRCLGQVQCQDKDQWGFWFKIKYGDRVGYVFAEYMEWSAINTF